MVSGHPENWIKTLHDYGHHLGMAFQVVDDILDFTGDAESMGKSVGSDLMQGTLTLPSLLLLEKRPDNNPIKRLLLNETRLRWLGPWKWCGSQGYQRSAIGSPERSLTARGRRLISCPIRRRSRPSLVSSTIPLNGRAKPAAAQGRLYPPGAAFQGNSPLARLVPARRRCKSVGVSPPLG